MKLLRRTGRSHLRYTALALAGAGVLLFVVLTRIIDEEITEKLLINVDRIEERLEAGGAVSSLPPVMEVERLNGAHTPVDVVKDTTLYDPVEVDEEMFREVSAVRMIAGDAYRITLRQVLLEPHDYLGSIGLALAIAFAVLLVVLVVLQRRIAKRIWEPFYRNLDAMKRFSLRTQQPISLANTDVNEFNDLNTVVEQLVGKVLADHRVLKEFSENAAHEMRTPLAVIQARLEESAQDPALTSVQAQALGGAQTAVSRLAQLNSALVLLTRIDNLQFTERVQIPVAEVIDEVIEDLQGHINERGLQYTVDLDRSARVQGEPALFRILVANLLKNAVGHNVAGGVVNVRLTATHFQVSNTGSPLQGDAQRMFERFARNSDAPGSIGLGLSIAQRICAVHGWNIAYSANGALHSIEVDFRLQDLSSIPS